MPGETSINTLLQSLKVTLHPSIFYFLTVEHALESQISIGQCHMLFREREGITLIVDSDTANKTYADLPEDRLTFRSKMITCDIHSSLEAVGFMPVLSGKLAEAGISCNPVSAFYHDHLFVPEERAEEAVRLLAQLASDANKEVSS